MRIFQIQNKHIYIQALTPDKFTKMCPAEDVAELVKRVLYNLTDNSLRFTVADQTDNLIAELEKIVRDNENNDI